MAKSRESKQVTVSKVVKDYDKGKLKGNHIVQRNAGIWSIGQMSLFIIALLEEFIGIAPIHIAVNTTGNKLSFIIDGLQRISTLSRFINNEFAICKGTPDFKHDNCTYNVSGMKFKDLSPELQEILLEYNVTQELYYDYDDISLAKIFKLVNNGTPLSFDQELRQVFVECEKGELLKELDNILSDNTMISKFAVNDNDVLKGKDITYAIKSIMIMFKGGNTSFSKNAIKKFIRNDMTSTKIDNFKEVHSIIAGKAFYANKNIKVCSIPFVYAAIYVSGNRAKCIKDINDFFINYNVNDTVHNNYREVCAGGCLTSKTTIVDRWIPFSQMAHGTFNK